MTFSIVARCARTSQVGIAISSSSPAVAARCVHTRAGVGAVASQNITDPALGPWVLDLMAGGATAAGAVETVRAQGAHMDYRQVLAIRADGGGAIHSGAQALGIWTQAEGVDAVAGGNLLANDGVPGAMISAFEGAQGGLAARLLAALEAGLAAGGEAGPVHSAGLQVAGAQSWPMVDLRCDWTDTCPIAALAHAWTVYEPQVEAYLQRARDPRAAPSYGVPGDL